MTETNPYSNGSLLHGAHGLQGRLTQGFGPHQPAGAAQAKAGAAAAQAVQGLSIPSDPSGQPISHNPPTTATLALRQQTLAHAAAQLKAELFGIDDVIDRVIDAIRAIHWATAHRVQMHWA